MRFLKMNNKNWKRLCMEEVQAKQLEINFKEVGRNMSKEDEGKEVIVISVDSADEIRGIKVGDKGEVSLFDCVPYILFKTGMAKGAIYCLNEDQLKVVEP